MELTSEQAEMLILHDSTILDYETKFSLRYIMGMLLGNSSKLGIYTLKVEGQKLLHSHSDSGAPLPKPPPPVWVPGSENRNFRGSGAVGPIEKFILSAIPKVSD